MEQPNDESGAPEKPASPLDAPDPNAAPEPAKAPERPFAAPSDPFRAPAPITDAFTPTEVLLTTSPQPEAPAQPAEPHASAQLEQVIFELKRVIVGQDRVIERLLVSLLARGHCLLEGVPGVAKTLATETLAAVVGGTFTRIQFTPDLAPSDIIGTRIWRSSSEDFSTEFGPIFANFVLADEVNRAPAKVQSAMLEVMAEGQVTIAGETRRMPRPFLVLATQNPIESDGVYPLPEAQRDRFLMKVLVGYPSSAEEAQIVHRAGVGMPTPSQILDTDRLMTLQDQVDDVFVDRAVVEYAVNLVSATRNPSSAGLDDLTDKIAYGASPRASLGLIAAGKALAFLRGRGYLLPQDVFDVAPEVLRHRLVLSYEALGSGGSAEHVLARILSTVVAPDISPREQLSRTPRFSGWDGRPPQPMSEPR